MTAVYGIAAAGADGSRVVVLDVYRTALVVPVVMVLLAAVVSAFGLRGAGPADGRRKGAAPTARDEVSDGAPS
ncbi:hypothetical protein [Streptomyces sp. NPDC005349]|uniref:hypothetical protein n=1 Tax=unclassified Streptomyces TaxID=2593676 RepID=UPI0033A60591